MNDGLVNGSKVSRRSVLGGLAGAAVVAGFPYIARAQGGGRVDSPFRLAVITDEITDDFDKACSIAANDFHLNWVEVRGMWGKNAIDLNEKELSDAVAILKKYELRVTDFASALYKVDFKGAPMSKFGPKRDQFGAVKSYDQQGEVLERSIAVAKAFKTDKIRGFDFWRLEDQKPYRAAIDAKLREVSERLKKEGLMFAIENEPSCNTATGAEAAQVLASVTNTNFGLNYDPGNSGMTGLVDVYPGDFAPIPKSRIVHCHCKDVGPKPGGGRMWLPVGKGIIDWTGQFKAFKAMGYTMGVSMETHWRGGPVPDTKLSPEAATRVSIAGMFDALRAAGCLKG